MNENYQQTLLIQQKIAFLARGAREIRPQVIGYTKAARESIGGGYLTAGETPEALQQALPRLEVYAKMGDHLVALADLFDEMVAIVKRQSSPEGKIILPARMLGQTPKTNGHNPVEEHAGRLYAAYCEAVGGTAHDGKPLPAWAEFRADPAKAKQSGAWVKVAALSLSSASAE